MLRAKPREVRLREVGERYAEGGGVTDVTLGQRSGETLAIVGTSGAGKTTLSRMLLGFISPNSGRIVIDGKDLSSLDLPAWQQQIGWLPQRPTLFAGSIAENILLSRSGISQAKVEAAAQLAQADTFIQSLPAQYDYPLGDGGKGLSGGQIQRIAMARAVLISPPVVILDEPTVALDRQTAQNMIAALSDSLPNSARLIITHDTEIAATADRVIVLEKGRVVEAGTPQALRDQAGVFAELERLQKGDLA